MNIEQFNAFWGGYTSALMDRNVERVLDHYTDDVVYDESPMMMSRPRRGKEQCRVYWLKVFEAFSSIRISTQSIVLQDDKAWVAWSMNNFHPATKTDVDIEGALVVTLRDGKLAHERLYWDRSKLLRDLGAWERLALTGIGLNALMRKLQ